MSEQIDMLRHALRYAQRWAIFPCRRNKTPWTKRGFQDATKNQDRIREWWKQWPDASIGVPTGELNGIWALDIDLPHGPESLARLEAEHGPLPETLVQRTGGGGQQYIFRWDDRHPIRNSAGLIGPGIDVRGEGGYIILPPSLHPSGRRYAWI
jgi:hypothetical protein